MAPEYVVRPLSDRTWLNPSQRTGSRFTVDWPAALELLLREIGYLAGDDARRPVIEVDIQEADLRTDGLLRSRARPASPGVRVSFETKFGPMMFRCDRYESAPFKAKMDEPWQHNVYAVALTLESLRAVDRYGASSTGQQYDGYRQITAGPADLPAQATPAPREFLADLTGLPADSDVRYLVRAARRLAHPDRGGDRTAWDQVQVAAAALGA